jgi:hypothetical protein
MSRTRGDFCPLLWDEELDVRVNDRKASGLRLTTLRVIWQLDLMTQVLKRLEGALGERTGEAASRDRQNILVPVVDFSAPPIVLGLTFFRSISWTLGAELNACVGAYHCIKPANRLHLDVTDYLRQYGVRYCELGRRLVTREF